MDTAESPGPAFPTVDLDQQPDPNASNSNCVAASSLTIRSQGQSSSQQPTEPFAVPTSVLSLSNSASRLSADYRNAFLSDSAASDTLQVQNL